jgi:hypothetical protein
MSRDFHYGSPSGVPAGCALKQEERNSMLSQAEIIEILNREVYSADATLADARQVVDAIITEVPGGLPHPDGQHRIANALKVQNKAREALKRAVQRNCAFTLNGVIQEDLK